MKLASEKKAAKKVLLLSDRLSDCGCSMESREFQNLVRGVYEKTYSDWSDEELMFRPSEALKFCKEVRALVGVKRLPDDLVLRALVTWRKCHKERERAASL